MNAQRLWIVGGVVVAVVIVAIGWLVGISPQFQAASAADSQYQGLQQQEQAQQAALASLQKQYDGIDDLKAQLAELQTSLPATRNLSDFLRQLDAVAKQSHVTLGSINVSAATVFSAPAAAPPATPSPSGGATATPGATPAPTATQAPAPASAAPSSLKDLYTIPVSLTAAGTRAALLDFVSAMQNGDERLFTVSNAGLNAASGASAPANTTGGVEGTGTDSAKGAYSLTLTGAIYVMLPTQ